MNDETAPDVGSPRTKQEGSAAPPPPEQSAAAPRTGAPNARNLAQERTFAEPEEVEGLGQ